MRVHTNQGSFILNSFDELSEFIRRRSTEIPRDEIWISGEEYYPCLSLLTNGEYASVNYFGAEGSDLWLSQGNLDIEIPFLAAGVEWKAPVDASIFLDDALACVEEFCETMSKPTCIDWQEL